MKQFYSGSFWGLVLILFSFTKNVAETLPADSSLFFYNKTFRLINKSEFDSALFSIRKAYAYGLSDDSLLYAWSEIYNAKGALDTAIALSLSIKSKPGHPLYYSVLKQRYFIYTLTNQKEKADQVFDTLSKEHEYKIGHMIPEISFSLGGGVQQNSIKEAEILPSYLQYAYPENEPARGTGSGGLNLKWNIPLRKAMGLEITTGVDIYQYNPPDQFRLKHMLDSSYSEEFAQCRYYILSGMVSGVYELSRLDEYADFEYFKHSVASSYKHKFNIEYLTFLKKLFFSGVTGYSYDISKRVHNWNVLLFGSREWSSKRSNSLSITINGIHMRDDTLILRDNYRKLYTDGNNLYLDSMGTHRVLYSIQIMKNGITDVFYNTIPRSYTTAKLSLSQELNLKHDFSFVTSIDGAVTRFNGFYSWVDSMYQQVEGLLKPNGSATMVVNMNDGHGYWASNLFPLALDSIPLFERKIHKKKRVDQTITANVSFKKDIKKIASIGLNGSVSRTFSNMNGHDAVIDVPVWAYSVMLSTTLKFNPSGRLP